MYTSGPREYNFKGGALSACHLDYQEPKKVTHHGHKKSPITGIKK